MSRILQTIETMGYNRVGGFMLDQAKGNLGDLRQQMKNESAHSVKVHH